MSIARNSAELRAVSGVQIDTGNYRRDYVMPAAERPSATYEWQADGDNYPRVRTHHYGQAAEYVHPFGFGSVFWIDAPTIPDAHRSVFLLDKAGQVTPFYVAGWSAADGLTERQAGAVLLYPMSSADRQSGYRWRIGPRRAYHLILGDPTVPTADGHPLYVPTPERPAVRTPLDDLRA